MPSLSFLRVFGGIVVLIALSVAAFVTRDRWPIWIRSQAAPQAAAEERRGPQQESKVLKLSLQARRNLGLVSHPVKLRNYWRMILVPGTIVDRPGVSDRGVTAPAVGVVVQVHAFPGDTVRPGDRLFTLRLISEYLQNTQSELFKTTRDVQLLKEQRARLANVAESGAIPQSKLIELDNQLKREAAAILAYRQDLLTRGLSPSQIESITEGKFVSTIEVSAPPVTAVRRKSETEANLPSETIVERLVDDRERGPVYEVQELKVDLGQQVQAGQLLGVLADHHSLFIAGHAFKQEAPLLEQAAQRGWPLQVEFAEDDQQHWPTLEQSFQIQHLANTIDPASRTFDFFVPLTNQSRAYEKGDKTYLVWRFRPGQRVRLHVPVEELQNVIVLPTGAVVREGPEAYVFQQNGDLFKRIPVHVLHEDRLSFVLANDGNVTPGLYFAQNGAASLSRVLKAQAASGIRADVHVHADGTVHAAH